MIIGLHGKKNSGKDTLAKEFIKLAPQYRMVSYADPIKAHVMGLFNIQTVDQYDLFKRSVFMGPHGNMIEGRHVVREIGMKMLSYDPSQFVQYIKTQIDQYPDILITDVRMPLEIEQIEEYGILVKVVRPALVASDDLHITERVVDDIECDIVMVNDGTPGALAKALFTQLGGH